MRKKICVQFLACHSPGHLQGPQAWIPQNFCGDCCGNCRGNSRCWGNCCENCRGECPCSEEQRETVLFPAVSAAVPLAPRVSRFRSCLRNSFGESKLGGPVGGRRNGNSWLLQEQKNLAKNKRAHIPSELPRSVGKEDFETARNSWKGPEARKPES